MMTKKVSVVVMVLFSIMIGLGCSGENETSTPKTTGNQEMAIAPSKMVQLIKEAHDKIDPTQVGYYNNSQRAVLEKQKMEKATDIQSQFISEVKYAYELINAGKNENAIVTLEGLLQKIPNLKAPPEFVHNTQRLLGIAYMRLGETNNCIKNVNKEACILPIKGTGIYKLPDAVNSAIRLFKTMLSNFPNDYEARWMLNFAYMTLGKYPAEVPKEYLIPASVFKSDVEISPFENIAADVGLNTLALSGGACLEDFNNDGFLDVIVTSWNVSDQMKYFENDGKGTFRDKTNQSGLIGQTGGLNINHMDYNNDGWKDVFVLRGAWFSTNGKIPNSLLKNNGDGTFTDVTIESGLLSYFPTQTATWADFNGDGWLDLFIGNESSTKMTSPCELYISNQDGTFENKSVESGLGNLLGFMKGCNSGDINNDGLPDLYISSNQSDNYLFLNKGLNENGIPQFENIAQSAGANKPVNSFPTWFFDYNNDGWEDIFVASFDRGAANESKGEASNIALTLLKKSKGESPKIYKNNKDNTFTDISKEMGIEQGILTMGSNFGDIDNDGFLDMYLGNGAPSFTAILPNKLYKNNAGKSFLDVTTSGRVGHLQKGHGVAFGDIDNDGDQDIFAVMGGAFEGDVSSDALFLNPGNKKNHWVTLRFNGIQSNRVAIGARVKLTYENSAGSQKNIFQTVGTGGSFGSNSLQLEMGLADAIKINQIEVTWPIIEQTKSIYKNLKIDSVIEITEGEEDVKYIEQVRINL